MYPHSQPKLQFNNLTHRFADKTILDTVSGSLLAGDKVGLVGMNGSGKSTFLKILSGIVTSDKGNVSSWGTVEYLPQLDLDLYRKEISLYQYLEQQHSQWWEVLINYEKLFGEAIAESRILATLSGGELMKLHLALALAKNPDVLLLDEPTNHLDLESLEELESILLETKIAFVIVSHKVDFLNAVATDIWELAAGKLTAYGGNYDFYQQEKERQLAAQEAQYEAVQKKLRKEKAAIARANERYQETQSKLTRLRKSDDRSMPKEIRNALKLHVQKNFGADKVQKDKKHEETKAKLAALKLEQKKQVHLNITASERSGLLINILNSKLTLDSGEILIEEMSLRINHGERISLLGKNGSGKTTLAKQLCYKQSPLLAGEVNYGKKYNTLYVDQKYDLIDPGLSVIENMQLNCPAISYEDMRKILANLSFRNDRDITKSAADLSGGETAKLAFAIATHSEVDLLVLDEPTNNLDIETVKAIARSLNHFQGTLLVISHDLKFLRELDIERTLKITDKKLIEL